MTQPAFSIRENQRHRSVDTLRRSIGSREFWLPRLYDLPIFINPNFKASCYLAAQSVLCLTWLKLLKTGFLV